MKKVFEGLKKFWDFIWNGKSWLSWVTFILVAFIVIKFIFFPFMTLITGSALPLAIVESCSMYHGQDFEGWWNKNRNWYENREIHVEDFEEFPLKNGFNKGDIFFVLGVEKEEIEVGDVIIFSAGENNRPIIHRVVKLNPLQTKGDHNSIQFTKSNNAEKIDETNIKEEQLIGRVTSARVPLLGWFKLIFFEPFRSEGERGFCKR